MTTNHVSLTDAPLVLVPQHFGCIVYDRRTCQYLPFDREATGVLRDLSRRSLAEVLAACPDAPERARILAFCDWGSALGLFTLDDRWAGAVLEITPPHDHLTGPLTVHLELTARCNLQCRHCFAESSPSRGTHDELPLDELEQLFVDMASCGAFRLGITGGEPLLRGDLADVLRLAGRHGLSPCLTTNGLLITDDLARQLADMRLAWLNVSLDGASARTHDAVRGPGAFERTLSRITVLRRHVPFSLAFTVMAQNLDEIGVCAQLARDVGAQAAVFRPLY
ncbi:MAG: radical SAM protein, partial [Tepidisphaeraceae bacterium]